MCSSPNLLLMSENTDAMLHLIGLNKKILVLFIYSPESLLKFPGILCRSTRSYTQF